MKQTDKHGPRNAMIIGWREHIALPQLKIELMTAKIDTGARTSALHAKNIEPFTRDGAEWVRFHIPHASGVKARDCEAPLIDTRPIKNTSGVPDDRYVIFTRLVIGDRRWKIEVSLADRAGMVHPIILGRTAFRRHGILVDANRSFLTGLPHPSAVSAA